MDKRSEDRISKFLSPRISDMMFGELSYDYLGRIGASGILGGVPVPVNPAGDESGGMNIRDIVFDMARVIGADPYFVYADKYAEFIKHAAGENAAEMLTVRGAESADSGDFEDACMLLRAALRMEPKSLDALYLYARACRECYEAEPANAEDGMGDEEKIGMFKAESLETFEILTMMHPDFAMGYYYLGYAYLNMGLYLKAKLTWEDFIKKSAADESSDEMAAGFRDEISSRLEELEDPVEIEHGCNLIMSGDYQGGKAVLDRYREGRYSSWWPLWYYLGTAESSLGQRDAAIDCFKNVLRLSPSNTDAMEELAAVYAMTGDEENADKYRKKIEIVRSYD